MEKTKPIKCVLCGRNPTLGKASGLIYCANTSCEMSLTEYFSVGSWNKRQRKLARSVFQRVSKRPNDFNVL